MSPQEAARLSGSRSDRAVGQTTARDLVRLVAADHPDRLIAPPAIEGAVFFRVDRAHEQPLVAARIVHGREEIVARFSNGGDAARLYAPDGTTLPASIVRALTGP